MTETRIRLPHEWAPRDYQANLWRYLMNGGRRAALKWHRRAGKDATVLHWTTVAATQRVGVYWHMLPTLRQGRKVVWENIDGGGNRLLDAWPGWRTPGANGSMVSHIRHDEMKIELVNGSIWYVVGSDNYDSVMGTNPVGITFSEWSLSNPKAWDFVRPILNENDGWAVFIWTPRGKNHASKLYSAAEQSDLWFAETLTVDDTCRPDGSPVITDASIQADRDEGVPEEHILQEYWCSEDAPLVGSYWGDQLIAAEKEGRICKVPHDPATKVDTWWDIGYSDATAVWFVQHVGGEIHLIDYDEASGRTPAGDAAMLNERARPIEQGGKGYTYGRHIWPHDGGAKTKASRGRPLTALYGDLGVYPEVQPRPDVEVAVQRARQILPRCWFDVNHTDMGVETLRAFRKQIDEDKGTESRPYYKPGYVHDWASHGLQRSTRVLVPITAREARSSGRSVSGTRVNHRSRRRGRYECRNLRGECYGWWRPEVSVC